ncbi:MAG: rRNA maturation RNase YbeY, partial [Deltaproteobacteria bacterium]|nr:rRNA maturation RNase YbeY [Deltaproteobacteria bacterium]
MTEPLIIDRQEKYRLDLAWLEERLARLLAALEVADRRLEVTLVDDVRISELNERFFRKTGPTNVISFPAGPGEENVLGEVIISVETAGRETGPLGYRLEEGLLYYLVHGVLHLVGYEHVGVPAARAAAMYA